MSRAKMYLQIFFTFSTIAFAAAAFNDYNSNKGLLSDVKAITLHQGKMTNARRSSPVPQLKCVGGSAQHKFQPKVVQCINQGSDGYDIQWECKTDMDNSYRFGHVEVSCEGYDYPNDPYVLKGSCGLEYTIDFTEEGFRKERNQNGGSSYSYSYSNNNSQHSEGGLGGLLVFCGIVFAIYIIYSKCLAPQTRDSSSHPHTSHQSHQPHHSRPSAPPQQPPSYGFKPEYMPGQGAPPSYAPPSYESSTGYTSTSNPAYDRPSHQSSSSTNQESSGPGFWTGAATGGLFGYLFGQNGQNRGYNNYHNNSWGGWGGAPRHNHHSSWGGFSSPSSSRSSSSSSSGSRMTSGFGGTSRR